LIADQLEPITCLPLRTAEDEDAWYEVTRAMMQRLRASFSDVASVVPHVLNHYGDADIHRKEPSYRTKQERYITDFIRELVSSHKRPNQAMERIAAHIKPSYK
jgi:hypothetical protein